jgi:hypothetical protein
MIAKPSPAEAGSRGSAPTVGGRGLRVENAHLESTQGSKPLMFEIEISIFEDRNPASSRFGSTEKIFYGSYYPQIMDLTLKWSTSTSGGFRSG